MRRQAKFPFLLFVFGVGSAALALAQPVTVRPNLPRTNNTVKALAIDPVRNIAYIGGDFSMVGNEDRLRLAAVDLTTGAVLPWNPVPNGTVETIAIDGDHIYIGGRFGVVSGSIRSRIARLNLNGTVDTTWNAYINSAGFPLDNSLDEARVLSIAVTPASVFVAGTFSQVQGLTAGGGAVARSGLVAFTKDNASVRNWNPNPNGLVAELFTSGSTLYALGGFTTISGGDGVPRARRGFAEFNNSVALQPLNPQATRSFGTVVAGFSALARRGETLFLGGDFERIGAENRDAIAAFGADDSLLPFDPGRNGPFQVLSLATDSTVLYASDNGQLTDGFFYYLRAFGPDGTLLNWRPVFAAGSGFEEGGRPQPPLVRRMIVFGNWLYLAGSFTTISGTFQSGFAAISLARVNPPAADPTPSAPTIARPTLLAVGKTKFKTTKRRVVLRGRATDATAVTFKSGKGRFKPAKGSASAWKIPLRLAAKRTSVKIRATGPGGQSPVLRFSIIRR